MEKEIIVPGQRHRQGIVIPDMFVIIELDVAGDSSVGNGTTGIIRPSDCSDSTFDETDCSAASQRTKLEGGHSLRRGRKR